MEQLAVLLERYGYALLFAVGFLEYVGAPIASVPILVVAGALASTGHFPLAGIIVAAGLITSAGIWRFLKVRMHRPHHEKMRAAQRGEA